MAARKVLVVDDNVDAAQSLAMLLRVTGTKQSLPMTVTPHFAWRRPTCPNWHFSISACRKWMATS